MDSRYVEREVYPAVLVTGVRRALERDPNIWREAHGICPEEG
jgi:hypothetical protein